jgi:outer membrane lipoprotein-sorting protein
MTRKWLRWMPAVAVPAVIAAAALAGSLPASAGDPLPAKTPAEVLALVAQHSAPSLSGTLEQTSRIGLPELPQAGPSSGSGGAASVLELLSGPHTARVFLDGPSNVRVQVLDRLAERNAVRSGDQVWLYSSKDNTAMHLTLPADAGHTKDFGHYKHRDTGMHGVMPTPEELAGRLIAAADPTTEVAVHPEVNVAGRAAYNLVITPRTEGTLIGSVAVAVDGESGLPLSVELKARGQEEPAFKLAFTSLSLEAPDASLFAFSPPPGATVKEIEVPAHGTGHWGKGHWPKHGTESGVVPDAEDPAPVAPDAVPPDAVEPDAVAPDYRDPNGALARPTVTGTGWESVVEFPASPASAEADAMLSNDPLLQQAAVAVPGGRLFSTAVVNVLFTDDGRVFAGSVPAERLLTAAAAR